MSREIGEMTLREFLELDVDELRALIRRRLARLERTPVLWVQERGEDLLEYGRELGPDMYRLDMLEGLRLFALAVVLECLDVADDLRELADLGDALGD